MLTNFMHSENKKEKHYLHIPTKPQLIHSFDVIRLITLLFCTVCLFIYSHVIIGFFTLCLSFYFLLFFLVRIALSIVIQQYINALKKLRKIYFTPVRTESGNTVTFTFLSPSETLVNKIEKLNSILKKRFNQF